MAGQRRVNCRGCLRHIDECGPLSKRGKCVDCGTRAVIDAARQIEARQGPYYDKWRREVAAFGRSVTEGDKAI